MATETHGHGLASACSTGNSRRNCSAKSRSPFIIRSQETGPRETRGIPASWKGSRLRFAQQMTELSHRTMCRNEARGSPLAVARKRSKSKIMDRWPRADGGDHCIQTSQPIPLRTHQHPTPTQSGQAGSTRQTHIYSPEPRNVKKSRHGSSPDQDRRWRSIRTIEDTAVECYAIPWKWRRGCRKSRDTLIVENDHRMLHMMVGASGARKPSYFRTR